MSHISPPAGSRRSTRAAAAALVVCLWSASGATAQTPDPPLSLGDVIELAKQYNPDYQTQRNQLHSADWNVRAAYGSWLPSMSVSNSFGYTVLKKLSNRT